MTPDQRLHLSLCARERAYLIGAHRAELQRALADVHRLIDLLADVHQRTAHLTERACTSALVALLLLGADLERHIATETARYFRELVAIDTLAGHTPSPFEALAASA